VEVRDPVVMEEMVDHMLLAGVSLAWGGPVDNPDQVDRVQLSTIDRQLCERVYVGIRDRAYSSPVYNRGIRCDVLLDARKGTHRPQNSIRISRTTNTLAYASDCIRARIHKHRPSCTSRVANAYRLSQDVPFREDE